jgi:sigma-E factor negative regulatory protein RseA
MSEQIREQISAFLDGELPNSEAELLLKRLTRDAELRECFGRYALIGESLRGGTHARLTQGFAARVNRAIDGEPAPVFETEAVPARPARWWRPLAGAALAAGVAAVAVVALQQRAISPSPPESAAVQNMANTTGPALKSRSASEVMDASHDAVVVQNAAITRQTSQPKPTEALSYTVPAVAAETPRAMPAARLTNYVFAHSKYSSVLGQNDVLNDLLSNADAEDAAAAAARDSRVAP